MRGDRDQKFVDWPTQKTDKYFSGTVQSEMVKFVAICVLHQVAANLQTVPFLTLMVDETTNESNVE